MIPSTTAYFDIELYMPAQRPCSRSALGRSVSEGRQVCRWCGLRFCSPVWIAPREHQGDHCMTMISSVIFHYTILISESSALSVFISIPKQPVPSLPLLSTLNLTTVILYYGLPKSQINRLQQIQNCLACTVVKAPKSSYITPILRSLHWLKINERIEYKLLSLTYEVLTTS